MCDLGRATPSRPAGGRSRGGRRAFAWALLVGALLVGIVAMHTLGHMVGHGSDPMGMSISQAAGPHTRAPAEVTEHALPATAQAVTVPDAPRAAPPSTSMATDPFDVCLAVLIAAGLLLTLRRLAWTIKLVRISEAGSTPSSSSPPLRGPPGFGLPLTRLAVLRI